MFLLLVFLLSLSLHSSVQAMEQKKDSAQESLKKALKSMIDFEDLDGTLRKITSSIGTPPIGAAVLQLCSRSNAIEQWREMTHLSEKPHKACAVGAVVAWLSEKSPKTCFYINRRLNDEVRTIQLSKTISLIDITPCASKVALTSGGDVEIWNINKFKKISKMSFNSEIITALVFYRHDKMILGTDMGCVYGVIESGKKFFAETVFKYPDSNNSAITSLATITGDFIISQDLQGVLYTYQRFKKLKVNSLRPATFKAQLPLILLFDSGNWLASAEGYIYKYESTDETQFIITTLPGGSLIGKTRFNAFVEFQANIDSTSNSCFAIKSFAGQILKEILVLKRTEPVVQKVDISEPNYGKDLIPGYVIYEEDEDKPWSLLARETTPTIAQLAFRVVLAEAYEQKNIEALEKLFAHEQFKSFGNYMQKLLLSEYDCKNKF